MKRFVTKNQFDRPGLAEGINTIDAFNRLAAYEDTGLEPEEIDELPAMWMKMVEELQPYLDAKREGRLAILPCKIGDDIWWIDDEEPRVKCDESGVAGIAITKDGVRILDHHGDLDTIGTRYCYLTKEDAEKALERGDY